MIKTIIASLALSTLCIPQVDAATVLSTRYLIDHGVNPHLVSAVERLGVQALDASDETFCSSDVSTPYALYHIKHNVIVLCTENMVSPDKLAKSYTHEVVHMVQDCRAGLHNSDLVENTVENTRYYFSQLPAHLQDNILRGYDQRDWNLEAEAYYFQDKPLTVLDGVNHFCFN